MVIINMSIEEKSDDFREWKRYILATIKSNSENIETLEVSFTEVRIELGKLKMLSVIIGGIAGLIGTLLMLMIAKLITG